MKVGQAMTRNVRSCERTQTLDLVMRKLWDHDLGAMPVVNEAGQPIAMITDRDVAVAAYTQGKPLSHIQVQTAMSQALHTTHVSDTLLAAEQLMRAEQLHRLPVIDESTRLVGILSLNDIARLRSQAAPTRNADPSQDLAATVAAISQKRRPSSVPPETARVEHPAVEAEPRRPAQAEVVRPQTARPSAPQRIAASKKAGRNGQAGVDAPSNVRRIHQE